MKGQEIREKREAKFAECDDDLDICTLGVSAAIEGPTVLGAFIADDVNRHIDKVVDTGHCVRFVQVAANAPHTSKWQEGPKVKGRTDIPVGAAIATFQDGKYWNKTDGSSHAAIYLGQNEKGIQVADQWKGQPVHERTIRFKDGVGAPHNDGDAFAIVTV